MVGSNQTDLDIKRALDLAVAAMGLALLSPFMIVVAIGIVLTMGRPVFFVQTRPGKNTVPFHIVKFRTMDVPTPGEAWHLTDETRLTPLGRFLRNYSLDELPELLNVVRGEMSLVGPRPLLMEYLHNYTETEARRHDMRPGITGLAQVRGRRSLPLSKRLELDVRYIDEWSLRLDFRIMLATVGTVFKERGDIPGQRMADVDDIGLWSEHRPGEDGDG